jgi:RNA polymerase sigma-70 factor (ECF subfamily)
MLNNALSKLNPKERAAILLYEVAEFSIEEIMNIQEEKSLSTVKSRLSRSRKKLKNILTAKDTGRHDEINNTNYLGDLENETIKLAAKIETEK